MVTARSGQPSVEEFFQFFLDHQEYERHAVYQWLLLQPAYIAAEQKIRKSKYFVVMLPESARAFSYELPEQWTEDYFNDHVERLKFDAQFEFARAISLRYWHYFFEKQSVLWKGGDSIRRRKAAVAAFRKAANVLRQGFGPHAEEDREGLRALLAKAQQAISGDDVPNANRVKAGSHRPAAVLIRELVALFHTRYDEYFPSIICDLVSIVEPDRDPTKTVERHIKFVKKHLSRPTDQ